MATIELERLAEVVLAEGVDRDTLNPYRGTFVPIEDGDLLVRLPEPMNVDIQGYLPSLTMGEDGACYHFRQGRLRFVSGDDRAIDRIVRRFNEWYNAHIPSGGVFEVQAPHYFSVPESVRVLWEDLEDGD